jgi:hypothetical protein
MTVAAISRHFEMEIVDSGLGDIAMKREYSFDFTNNYEWSVKARITKVVDQFPGDMSENQ